MEGGVAKLQGALVDAVEFGHHAAVFRLGVVGVEAADVDDAQTAAALDLGHHAAQGVGVGLQKQGVIVVFATQVDEDAALDRALGAVAQGGEFPQNEVLRCTGVAGGAVDGQQFHGLLHREVYIMFHSIPPVFPFEAVLVPSRCRIKRDSL